MKNYFKDCLHCNPNIDFAMRKKQQKSLDILSYLPFDSGLDFFGEGYGVNNEPLRAYCLVFIIAVTCILIGDLNQVFFAHQPVFQPLFISGNPVWHPIQIHV